MFWLSRATYSGVPGCGPGAWAAAAGARSAAASTVASSVRWIMGGVRLPAGRLPSCADAYARAQAGDAQEAARVRVVSSQTAQRRFVAPARGRARAVHREAVAARPPLRELGLVAGQREDAAAVRAPAAKAVGDRERAGGRRAARRADVDPHPEHGAPVVDDAQRPRRQVDVDARRLADEPHRRRPYPAELAVRA